MVDLKIGELVKDLGMYQLQLESEANAISNDFKKEVMSMMLYDEKKITIAVNYFKDLDLLIRKSLKFNYTRLLVLLVLPKTVKRQ